MFNKQTDGFTLLLNQGLADNEHIFKLSKAVLDSNDELVVQLLVNADDYDKFLTDDLRKRVNSVIKTIIPEGIFFHVVYKKTETTDRYVTQNVYEFFNEQSSLIYNKIKGAKIDIEINYGTVLVRMGVTPDMYGYLLECKYGEKLAEYLEERIMEEVEVEFYRLQLKDDVTKSGLIKIRSAKTVRSENRLVNVRVNLNVLGAIAMQPTYIIDATKSERASITLCGKVMEVNKLTSKAGKEFFRATIDDTTGTVTILMFPRFPKQIQDVEAYLLKDSEVCVEGELKMDERSGSYVLFTRKFALCNIDYSSISLDVVYNECPEYYERVHPEKYMESEQSEIFGNEGELPELLKGKIVVFDLETTGLTASTCKIIEIGAVLMEDGIIKETFSTLINPMEHIPEGASEVNHIYDKDVVGAPEFKDVVGDFYKFCQGATLCGHNVNFDVGFITFHGKKEFYNFDHPTLDTLDMAKRIFKRDRRNTLGDLCKEFNIPLENAHRALYDTIATAKVLKKLAYLSNK